MQILSILILVSNAHQTTYATEESNTGAIILSYHKPLINIAHPNRRHFICTHPLKKTPDLIWSSVDIKFNSLGLSCSRIIEDVNVTNLDTSIEINQANSVFGLFDFTKLIGSMWQGSAGWMEQEPCDRSISVPLFRQYCLLVEFDPIKSSRTSDLDVQFTYVFTYVDLKMVIYFVLGVALYFSAGKLSRNEIFHYFSGISIGVLGAILILVFILIRFIPQKKFAMLAFLTSSSIIAFFYKWLLSDFKSTFDQIRIYAFIYILASALISGVYLYLREPLKNPRVFNLIELILTILGVVFFRLGISYWELSSAILIGYGLTNMACKSFSRVKVIPAIKNRYFPDKRKLLSQEEYQREADEFTRKALSELKEYCASPECNVWRTLKRLSNPEKMIKFVGDQDCSHVSDDEIQEYEKYAISNDLVDEENEE